MKTFSKTELLELGLAVANTNQVDTLFATEDGQFFLKENFAKLHANANKLKVEELNYNIVLEIDPEIPSEDAQQLDVAVQEVETVITAEDGLEAENSVQEIETKKPTIASPIKTKK